MTSTYVVRLWLPDRPGALGQVASRVGAVGGDVVGIDILERGAGRAIDELVVELPEPDLVDLMVAEMQQVDGVDVETITPVADSLRDPRLDALETAAILVGVRDRRGALQELCVHAVRTIGARWSVVVDLDGPAVLAHEGEPPPIPWLVAYVEGSQSSARVAGGNGGPADVVWAPLPRAGMAMVLGRDGTPFRARERRQAAALARIVDTRFRELSEAAARSAHPSSS
jgi:hypothetical protein